MGPRMMSSNRPDAPGTAKAPSHGRALARQQRILRRAARTRAQLNAAHSAGPDEYLSAGLARRESIVSERPMVMWITDARLRPRRPHRRTLKPRGRPRKNENDKAAEAAFGAEIEAAIDKL